MPFAYDPYLDDPNKEKDDEENAQGPAVAGSGQLFGGGGETMAQGSGGAKPSRSDRFQNLNDYIGANEGAQFGQQFAGKVNENVDKAGVAQQSGENEFKGAVDKNTVKEDKDLVNSALSDAYGFTTKPKKGGTTEEGVPKAEPAIAKVPQGLVSGQTNTYEDLTPEERIGKFQQQLNANYGGPTSLSSTPDIYSRIQGATQKAQDTAKAAQSEPGRFALLDEYFGRNASDRPTDYSLGQKSLDNLLVQQDPQAQQSIQQARENAQKYAGNLDSEKQNLTSYAAAGRGTTEAARQGARGALGMDEAGNLTDKSPILAYQKAAQDRAAQLNQQKAAETARLKSELKNRIMSAEDMQKLGLTRGQQLYGLDPTSGRYFQTAADLDYNQAATPWEQQQVTGLSKLGNLENTYLPYADKAGGYDASRFNTLNNALLNQDINSRKLAYENELNAVQQDPYTNDLRQSLKQGLARDLQNLQQQEQINRETGTWGDSYGTNMSQYQQRLQALANLQKKYGYGDTLGKGIPDDDWRKMKNYAGTRLGDVGEYRSQLADYRIPGIDY